MIRAIFRNKAVPFNKKFFRKTFVQYVTVWLVRIWTHKNADKKAHTLSWRSKNVKKRMKTYEKRILCKFTLTLYIPGYFYILFVLGSSFVLGSFVHPILHPIFTSYLYWVFLHPI